MDIAVQIAEALEEAHERGIIHRDIKSSNLIITPRGEVKVLDFGLAKVTQRAGWDQEAEESGPAKQKETASGMIMGTVHYMSPEQDPRYALAYVGLADSYSMLGTFQILPLTETYPRAAKAAAMTALKIDDTLSESHTSLAWVKFRFELDWSGAESEFKRAIELNSTYPTAHHWYATYLDAMGRWEEALSEIQRAQELDPLSLIINAAAGLFFYRTRHYDLAIEQLQKTLELDSNFATAHRFLGEAYKGKGRFKEAIAEMQKAIALSGGSYQELARLGNIYVVAGERSEALRILHELKQLSRQ